MGVAVDELHAVFSQLSLANVVALEELLHVGGEGGDRPSLMDTLEDTAADNPVEVAEDRELRRFLARAINTLPEREKTVVTLYYYEGLTLAEIGNVLGVTESRVSQIHTKSVLQLRRNWRVSAVDLVRIGAGGRVGHCKGKLRPARARIGKALPSAVRP